MKNVGVPCSEGCGIEFPDQEALEAHLAGASGDFHIIPRVSVQELRNIQAFSDSRPGDQRQNFIAFVERMLDEFPEEVLCEICGESYVLEERCPRADGDDPETSGRHITIQNPKRPWNTFSVMEGKNVHPDE